MVSENWRLNEPVQVVVFDCDGTLSQIEGIDELATMNGVGNVVRELTEQAMSFGHLNESLYAQRLALTRPTAQQCEQLGDLYYQNRVHGIESVIKILQYLKKDIYILSAGLMPAITRFMKHFNIDHEQCLAVDIYFDDYQRYQDFDHSCPLIDNRGKYEIIERLKQVYPRILHIGDGMNDYSAHDLVSRFVGFGGVFHRETLKQRCEFYLETPSLLGLLPLVLTEEEEGQLPSEFMHSYEQGLSMLHEQMKGNVK